jgi:hypothetical protein
MSDRKPALLRLLIFALVLSNVGLFLYIVLTPDPQSQTAARIEALQINPGRIKVLGAASRGPAALTTAARGDKGDKGGGYRACLEWGPFAAADVSKAAAALDRLALSAPAEQRAVGEASGGKRYAYFLREPDAKVVAQIAELQRGFPGTEIKAAPCP